MIKAAVVGYGNIGKYVIEALLASPDFEIAGVVRRDCTYIPDELRNYIVTDDLSQLDADVAILCTPTRKVEEYALHALELGMNTIDSFDIHSGIVELRRKLDRKARECGRVSIISSGWDPGSDSVVRTLLQACAPNGVTYTNFGPGMSMGHTVAVKAIKGVKDALSVTIPLGTGIHRRMVYIELQEGYSLQQVAAEIKADPYFVNDETHVMAVECVNDVKDMGHGVNMVRKGTSGMTPNQRFDFNMSINNPALTAQMLVNVARASMHQEPGAYTMIEIPIIDLLPGNREELIKHLV